jgi:hypothetical protein
MLTRIKEHNGHFNEVCMKKTQWTSLCALVLLLFPAMPVGAFEIGARALYWFPALAADIRVDSDGRTGTTLNLKDKLGVGDESFPTFEVFAGGGRHHLSFRYTPLEYSGTTTLTAPVTFDGKIFIGNVDSELKLRMLDLEYNYDFIDMENILAGFSFSVIGRIKYIEGEAKMNAPNTGITAAYKGRAPIPMVGLGTHIGLLARILELRANVTGVTYSGNYLYEAMADLSLTPFPFLDIHAGYKVIRLKIDQDDLLVDSQFAGPYIGLTVGF